MTGRIPRKYVLIGSHCVAFAAAVLVAFLLIKNGTRGRGDVGEMFPGYVRLVPFNVAYAWGTREDAEAAVHNYLNSANLVFVDDEHLNQKNLFFAKSRLAVLGNDPHATIAALCKEVDNDGCRPETVDRWIELIRRGRKVPN